MVRLSGLLAHAAAGAGLVLAVSCALDRTAADDEGGAAGARSGGSAGVSASAGSSQGGSAGDVTGTGGNAGAADDGGAGQGTGGKGSGGAGGATGGNSGTGGASGGSGGAVGGAGIAGSNPTGGGGGAQGGAGAGAGMGAAAGAAGVRSAGAAGAGGAPTCRDVTYDTKTYRFCPFAGLDWFGARAYCQGIGSDLISINTEAENTFAVAEDTEGGSMWTSANDLVDEGVFQWGDGTYVSAGFMNWAATQPNDAETGEDCAVLHSGAGEWNDVACTEVEFGTGPISLICESP